MFFEGLNNLFIMILMGNKGYIEIIDLVYILVCGY